MATRYVRYVGPAHRRVISSADWRSVRVNADQIVWEAQNGFALPVDMFTEDQIKRAIEVDEHLVITEEGDGFEPTYRPYDMTPRELRESIENPVDLVAVLNGDAPAPAGISGPSTGLVPGGNVRTSGTDKAEKASADR